MAHARLVPLLGLLALLAACKPKGSCDARADQAKTCTDIMKSDVVETQKKECPDNSSTHVKGTWSDAPCAHDDAIGGCENALGWSRTWYYPGGRVTKIEQVAGECPGGKVLDANGKKVKVTAEYLPAAPTAEAKPDPKVEAIVAAISKIKLPSGAASGTIKPTGGKTLKEPAAQLYERDLTGFGLTTYNSTADYPTKTANDLLACATWTKEKKKIDKYSDGDLKRALAWCATLEYLLVVKLTKYKNAELLNGSQFVPGFAEGFVYAYELPSGAAIGGYSFKAESNKTVTGAPHSGTIEKDFKEQIEKALNGGLKKASPSAALQFDL